MTITEFQQACSAIEQDYKTKISQAADLAAVDCALRPSGAKAH